MDEQLEIIGVEELATFLNCSSSLIHKLKNNGKIPFFKVGSSVKFIKKDVLTALKEPTAENF